VRGHVRRRRTWEFIVDVGPHPVTGRRRQKSKSGFATKKEAESVWGAFIRFRSRPGIPSSPNSVQELGVGARGRNERGIVSSFSL
jgi:Arm DNA-binding domain